MLDVDKMVKEILSAADTIVTCYGQHMNQGDFADMAKDANSQITKAIIREHEMQSLENDHPALKELREKLNMMTTLLRKQDE